MFLRMNQVFHRLVETIRLTPMEFGISLLYWVLCVLDYKNVVEINDFGSTFPICFGIVYGINNLTRGHRNRWMYYSSFVVAVWLGVWNPEFWSASYWVSLLISQMFVVYSRKDYCNEAFVRNGVNYVCDAAVALCLGGVCHLLLLAIYYSFVYIFDIQYYERSINTYFYLTVYLILTPVFFLLFNTKTSVREVSSSRFSQLLSNFILTPALLAYMLLLYLYVIKIAFTWSLPKGGVAYMVTTFISLVFCMKAVQPLLKKRYYDWFYNYFSWWVLPALVMLWVGVSYRVWEYGLTEKRFYLLLATVTLTVTVIVSFKLQHRMYAMLTGFSVLLLALFTYIPGITAKDVGVMSQRHYLDSYLSRLQIVNKEGYIVEKAASGEYDAELQPLYEGMYNSFKFLQEEKGEAYMLRHYGISTSQQLRDSIIPENQREFLGGYTDQENYPLHFYAQDRELLDGMDIRRFSTIQMVEGYMQFYSYSLDEGVLTLKKEDQVLAEIDLSKWFAACLAEAGFDIKTCSRRDIENYKNPEKWMVCDTDKIRILFRRLEIAPVTYQVENVEIRMLLME